ncbi:MAG: hypothetical protein KJP15_05320 [Gammaproteobacteria bacterium]|nr:hypothetical protein [Gammaproteobacteria bacterium]
MPEKHKISGHLVQPLECSSLKQFEIRQPDHPDKLLTALSWTVDGTDRGKKVEKVPEE